MPLKESTGNMYKWVTHTWNPVRGKCGFDCSYCYVGKWGKEYPIHFVEAEMRANLGSGNYIFICSGCDLFHHDIPENWIDRVIDRTRFFQGNEYLWHTKNPARAVAVLTTEIILGSDGDKDILCTTIESDKVHTCMAKAPHPKDRAEALSLYPHRKMITVEPIMDFDLKDFTALILSAEPEQVNIGADSCRSGLREPPAWKIKELIEALEKHTKVHRKKNLERLFSS